MPDWLIVSTMMRALVHALVVLALLLQTASVTAVAPVRAQQEPVGEAAALPCHEQAAASEHAPAPSSPLDCCGADSACACAQLCSGSAPPQAAAGLADYLQAHFLALHALSAAAPAHSPSLLRPPIAPQS